MIELTPEGEPKLTFAVDGEAWPLTLTINTLKRIRARTGIKMIGTNVNFNEVLDEETLPAIIFECMHTAKGDVREGMPTLERLMDMPAGAALAMMDAFTKAFMMGSAKKNPYDAPTPDPPASPLN